MADGNSYPAIIDTGAMDTTINVAFAPLLGLANEGPLAPPFGRHATGYQSTLRGARLGSLALPDRSVAVMASPLADAAAIISPAAFMGKLVRLDMGQGVLQVCPKTDAHLPRTAPFAYSPPPFALPSFPLTIDGRTFQAHLDTGSGNQLIFPTALAQQLEIEGEWRQVGTARLHAGPARPIYRAKLKGDARIGPVTIRQPEVASLEIIPQVNIGMGILRGLVVTIDPAERRSWVERPVIGLATTVEQGPLANEPRPADYDRGRRVAGPDSFLPPAW
jgi:hypothetical protein